MNVRRRAFGSARVWAFVVLVATVVGGVAGAVWVKGKRARLISAWKTAAESRGMVLRVAGGDGLMNVRVLRGVELEVSPSVRLHVARIHLAIWPWERVSRADAVVVRLHGPLDGAWRRIRGLPWPSEVEVGDVHVEYTVGKSATLTAEGARFEPGTERDGLQVQSLHVWGTTFRNVHLWVTQPHNQLEIRLTSDPQDASAPKLGLIRTPGQGVEWTLDIPSQPFSRWARRAGLRHDEAWATATIVGTGSLILPESSSLPARADVRFTLDGWHQPSWAEASLLTGKSGAIALRIAPGPGTSHSISRVEVEAGLFSLVGTGQLTFGAPNRLTFDARGQLSCARLQAHLPASGYRERIRAHLREHPEDATNGASVRLELAVRGEAPDGVPLKFRWHLHPGCGLSELREN